ncbi:MAG TPA: cyclic nucleotide-binding domain-containing protein [Spirochaetota bacterium]|nr:cyclic nucleotide-binding domain-containing protein [Spirochaetota bacterium]
MNKLIKTLQGIPFFAHLSLSELMELVGISGLSIFKKGQSVLLKKSSSLYVVISGIFEVESFAERDVLYLPSGAFFGSIPFADIKIKGEISAMTDAEVLILPEDALFRFLFSNHRLLRGYLRILSDLGYEINESARSFVSIKLKL